MTPGVDPSNQSREYFAHEAPTAIPGELFAAYAGRWSEDAMRRYKGQNAYNVQNNLTRYILPAWGQRRLDSLTQLDVDLLDASLRETTSARQRPLAENRRKNIVRLAVQIWKEAHRYLEPCDAPKATKNKRKAPRSATPGRREEVYGRVDRAVWVHDIEHSSALAIGPAMRFVVGHVPVAIRAGIWPRHASAALPAPGSRDLFARGWVVVKDDGPYVRFDHGRDGEVKLERLGAPRQEYWSPTFSHLLSLYDWEGQTLALDVDVLMLDQMNSVQDSMPEMLVDWRKWAALGGKRFWTSLSTCYRTFNENMAWLQEHLAREPNAWFRSSPGGLVFLFIQHQVLRLQRLQLSRSHALRLASESFRFGEERANPKQLFCPSLDPEAYRQHRIRTAHAVAIKMEREILVPARDWSEVSCGLDD